MNLFSAVYICIILIIVTFRIFKWR